MAKEKPPQEASGLFNNLMKVFATLPKVERYIPNEILDSFTAAYENDDIWKIHSGNYWLTIFLYKENQIEANKDLPKYSDIKNGYLKLANEYIDPEVKEIYLTFDSKENFEKKYGGNWYDYYH